MGVSITDRFQEVIEDAPGERLLLVAQSDLDAAGRYGAQCLVLTTRRVLLFADPEADPRRPAREIPLREIQDVHAVPLAGRLALTIALQDRHEDLITCTHALAPQFQQVAASLAQASRTTPTEPLSESAPAAEHFTPPPTPAPPRSAKMRVLRWGLKSLKPHWPAATLIFLLILVNGLLALAPPYLVKRLVDGLMNPTASAPRTLVWPIAALGAVYGVITLFSIIEGRLISPLGSCTAHAMRIDFYDAIQRLQLTRLQQFQAGDLVFRMTQDVQTVHTFIMDIVVAFAPQLIILAGVFAALCVLHWALALVVIAPVPLVVLLASLYHRHVQGRFARATQRLGRLHARANDRFQGVRDVKLMGREAEELEQMRATSWSFCAILIEALKSAVLFAPAVRLVCFLGVLPVLYLGGMGILGRAGWPWQGITLGTLIAFITYLGLTYAPVNNLGLIYSRFTQAYVAARRLFEILDAQPEPYDAPGARTLSQIEGELSFEEVHFAYVKERPVLRGISFHVRPGEVIGIVGRSGSGKTTMANLVCRFFDPQQGAIRLDGVDLRDLRLESLRAAVGVIPQTPWLFDGTVAENIAFGKPGATSEEIVRATLQANIHDIVMRWPEGFDTRVGQGGLMLSGGERHLIAIARAYLRNPRLLILDEATAAMDHFTEQQVQERLFELMRGRTCFIIAHRLSTLRHADRIMVIDDGRLAEWGTPEELRAQRGIYHQLMLHHANGVAIHD